MSSTSVDAKVLYVIMWSPSEQNYEGKFVMDLLNLETDQIIEKWCGGKKKLGRYYRR
ncbi:hypothetical protein ACQKNX_11505 [Lysinibacillus sp. NPDC093712]|uniref:hypothetical protein n=1 Tax=Lysinibacillus sp. NPDC093712 TaxID=3390579 RepID=UPI003D062C3A